MALSALLHDLGKLAERARIFDPITNKESLDAHRTQFCPFDAQTGRHSHIHAAYTGMSYDLLENKKDNDGKPIWPDIKSSDTGAFPFTGIKRNHGALSLEDRQTADDSLVSASAMHHKPETFLQWIIATADRVASSFERTAFDEYNTFDEGAKTDHYTARLWSLLERIEQPNHHQTRYPLMPYSPASTMPNAKDGTDKIQAQAEYRQLWNDMLDSLGQIPASHRHNLPLWLDHFDSLWLTFTHCIPSSTFKTEPDVSLYDHSKTAAALATALWRWYVEQPNYEDKNQQATWATALKNRDNFDTQQLLLIQGDFTGIQNFLFANGGESTSQAARLLRGRSFYVSLICELAALKLLEALGLPSTSQIINAAGKFLIVAPATANTISRVQDVEQTLNTWCLAQSFGEAAVVLAIRQSSLNDLMAQNFKSLMSDLFEQLDEAKLQRFNLLTESAPDSIFAEALTAFENDKGTCSITGKHPAQLIEDNIPMSRLARDQITCGKNLANPKRQRIMITDAPVDTAQDDRLLLDIFGYYVTFTNKQGDWNNSTGKLDGSGKFGDLARTGTLKRFWDISLPVSDAQQALWNGYARRYINAYVPVWQQQDLDHADWGRYNKLSKEEQPTAHNLGKLKSLNHLACEDRSLKHNENKWLGQVGLMTLKGDIDSLGKIFQQGLEKPTFAKMASLSRQVNAFFAIYLPWLCQREFPNTYTVFAGGDDFFLIGPWHQTLALSQRLHLEFANYVSHNPNLHFSAGLVMSKPGLPIHTLATQAEEALANAKTSNGTAKKSVHVWGQSMEWQTLMQLLNASKTIDNLHQNYDLSMGYRYGLLSLTDMAGSSKPEDNIWRARLAYRTQRYVVDKIKESQRNEIQSQLNQHLFKGIEQHKLKFKIALFAHLYQYRD
jgi:CRISPR-associated protein Csm1